VQVGKFAVVSFEQLPKALFPIVVQAGKLMVVMPQSKKALLLI
jgi:hypothetical protein